MLYGSVARGTADCDSDIDVLELVTGPAASYEVGKANVTQYEASHLRSLAEQGSLFVLHLRNDGVVLSDPGGVLRRTLNAYSQPSGYCHVRRQLRDASALLDPAAVDFDAHTSSLARLGIYLLRTSVYLRTAEAGQPAFDLGAIEWLNGEPDLQKALALRRKKVFYRQDVEFLREQLGRSLGGVATNHFASIEALAVAQASRQDLLPLLGAVLQNNDGVDYSSLSLPPF